MKRPVRIDLASTRLAFYVIAFVVLQILISAIVPQQNIAEDQLIGWRRFVGPDNDVVRVLWLNRIYFSPVFHASLALLAANLIAGNVRRFRKVLRTRKTLAKVRQLGSIIFHLALLTVIAGVLFNSLTRFDRVFGLTTGQTADDLPQAYFRSFDGTLAPAAQGEFRLELTAIDPAYQVRGAATEAAMIALMPTDRSPTLRGMVHVNHPVRWREREIHLGSVVGYSPEVIVLGPDGRIVFKKFIRLKVEIAAEHRTHEDFVILPQEGLHLQVAINPEGNDPATASRFLTVTRADTVLFQGRVAAGDTVTAADYRIAIPQIRRWCYLHVISNPGLPVVFAGFWICLAGLAVSAVSRVVDKKERKT